jgi:hypothetical protein
MQEKKYYVMYNPDGYHLTIEEFSKWEAARDRCTDIVTHGGEIAQVIYGGEIEFKPVETVITYELENPEDAIE